MNTEQINLKFLVRFEENSYWSSQVVSRRLCWRWNNVKTLGVEWLKRFQEGRENVEVDSKSGRPSTSRTGENI